MAQGIYFDHSSTTRVRDSAFKAMVPFFKERFGIISQPHRLGQELLPDIEGALKEIYRLLGAAEADDFVLTSSGAEAINHVIFSTYYDITRLTGKNHFLTSATDEAAMIMAAKQLKALGCVSTLVPVTNQGVLSVENVVAALTPRTVLFSLSLGNGLTGTLHPYQLSQELRQRGILFHLDLTHTLGKLPCDLDEMQPDFVTFNGDQLGAPKGTGGLLIRAGRTLSPFILGSNDSNGFRAGPLNVPFLTALGAAAAEAVSEQDFIATEVARLRYVFETGITAAIAEAVPLFKQSQRLPHISVIAFPGVINEALLYLLSRRGVYASIGGGQFQQLSLNLQASQVPLALSESAISFSFSAITTEEEIEEAILIIQQAYSSLKKMSTHLLPAKEL